MINPRWRKIIGDLMASKTRTLLVVLSIAVGVFGIGTIIGSRIMMEKSIAATYRAMNPATATFYADSFDNDLIRALESRKEVKEAAGHFILRVRAKIGPDEWKNLNLHAIPDFDNISINKIRRESGDWPPKDGAVLLERSSLPYLHVEEGQWLTIETSDRKKHKLRVSGIVRNPNDVPASWKAQADGFLTFATLADLGESYHFNCLNVIAKKPLHSKKQAQDFATDLRDNVIEERGIKVSFTEVPTPGQHWFYDPMNTMMMLMLVIGLFALALSGFQVVNTISALLKQQVRQIGIMKAIGARASQVIGLYLGMVFVYGLLALAIALPAGAGGAVWMAHFTAGLFNLEVTTNRMPMQVMLLEGAIAILVPILAGAFPVISAVRTSVREALGDYGTDHHIYHESRLDRLIAKARRLSRPIMLSLRNTFRHKWRVALTLTTLVLGGAILIAVFSVRTSLLMTLDDLMRNFIYDIEINFSQPQRIARISREAQSVTGVARTESWAIKGAVYRRQDDSENESITVIAPPPESNLIKPIMKKGRWLISGEGNSVVVNTSFLKDEPDVDIGDEIILKFEGKETSWRVVGVASGQVIGPTIYASGPKLNAELKAKGVANRVVIETAKHDADFQSQVAKALEKHFRRVGPNVSGIQTNAELRARIESQFNLIVIFLLIMAVLLAVVGGLGLMGTMGLNVIERTKEIGIMRAIGATNMSIQQIVIIEGVLIGFLSWLLAAVMAIPLSRILSDQVGVRFLNAPLSFRYSISGALLWLVASIMLAAFASFIPARRASQVSIRDVLAYE